MTKRYKNETHNTEDDMNYNENDNGHEYASPKKLRRNKIDGQIGGICSGFGDYFGLDHVMVRILMLASLFLTAGTSFWVYLGCWVFIPSDKRAPYRREYREARKARRNHQGRGLDGPVMRTSTFKDVKSKFRSLETRLQDLERSITSKEWKLRRDFRDLEG